MGRRSSYHSAILPKVTITSRQNPLVARFRAAARGDADGAILLDGAHLVADALAAGLPLRVVAFTPSALERREVSALAEQLARASVEVATVSAVVMDAMSPVRSPSAIVGLAERPVSSLDRVFAGAAPLTVVATGVQDPGNVGAIVRVAEAGGATGFIAAEGSADPFGWKALRGSMGSALRLPVFGGIGAEAAVSAARDHRCRVVATVPRGGRSLVDVSLVGPTAILIGGEGQGLPASIVDAADERVTIPMQAPVESLNAAVTAALIVYEALRQRSATKTRKHEK
jgi:RNA methyltransferase, TrmH family